MNAIERLRKAVVSDLMSLGTIQTVWPHWSSTIKKLCKESSITGTELQNIGNHLFDIFKSTSKGRGQSEVSGGGVAWEALVCWYLNLCLLGSRTVIIKAKQVNIPTCIRYAISVNYGNFPSNTESDLLAVTFPVNSDLQKTFTGDHKEMMKMINQVVENQFTETELGIIQCKTNWNDNAQIPMLWDLIYASNSFSSGATVGSNGFSHKRLKKFTYSFVTVPTVKPESFKPTTTAVMRVKYLSGGNYWGLKSKLGIASNLFDIIQKNFATSHREYPNGWHLAVAEEIMKMKLNDNYFKL
ncbi:hypothetical protein [Xenorhabdus eapokensis]|uniref:Uncharacterized protein n=1 Tax=Xenorhabdus eapokensis TaxID=1873482 RepID=A0A1Q5THR8_9GAMM|nr:hypothetical protein [Xenorhabdus eapokensis]OKO99756.1 hypothetical protein Xedl_03512 [Xenorhabdus eapokensis]